MAASDITKHYRTAYWVTRILSICLTVVPMLVFCIMGFAQGETKEKLALGCTITVAVILCVLNVLMKYSIRSTVWILMIGIYLCLENIMPMILTVAVCTIIDEFVVSPLCKSYKTKLTINKEMDKRL